MFLFLSLNQMLAASSFVLGPYVWEIFETERVCHPPDICIVEVGPATEMLTQSLRHSFTGAFKRSWPHFKTGRALLSLNLLDSEMHPGFWGRSEPIYSFNYSFGILQAVAKASYHQLWLEIRKGSCWNAEWKELYWIRKAFFWIWRRHTSLGNIWICIYFNNWIARGYSTVHCSLEWFFIIKLSAFVQFI